MAQSLAGASEMDEHRVKEVRNGRNHQTERLLRWKSRRATRGKIARIEPSFDEKSFRHSINKAVNDLALKARVDLIAQELKNHLLAGHHYPEALQILLQILGPENPKETGMFTTGYWLMPVAKFVELYGLEHYDISMQAIYEITKRHTGEYAVRPYIEHAPRPSVRRMKKWARDANVHVRRLASEGLRPRLPWAKKLDAFIADPQPVVEVLELLKADPSNFVKNPWPTT